MPEPGIQELLREGIAAAKTAAKKNKSRPVQSARKSSPKPSSAPDNQKKHARQLLLQVIKLDEANVQAWLWLSVVMDDFNDRLTCFNNVLALDPGNRAATAGLALLKKQRAASGPKAGATKSPATLKEAPQERPKPPADQPASSQKASSHTGCPFCKKSIGSMDMTCPHCELPLVMDCPACNTLMDVEWEKCSNCDFEMGDYRLRSVYFYQLGMAYHQRHRANKAIEALRIAKKIMPDQPDLYRQIGQVQAALGQTEVAISTLERAVELEPDQAGPYLTLGKVLQQGGRWREAEKVYRKAMDAVPESSETYYAFADLLTQRNRLRQAQKYLKKAIKVDPQHGPAWTQLGQIFESTHKRPAAIRAYRQAINFLEPESFEEKRIRQRLRALQPKLPTNLAQGWAEFTRQITGPILVCILAALLDSGLRPWWIPWTGWLALFLAVIGSLLWVSGTSLPQNPFICSLIGNRGAGRSARPFIAFFGALFWLLAMGIILMPIGQSYPEPLL